MSCKGRSQGSPSAFASTPPDIDAGWMLAEVQIRMQHLPDAEATLVKLTTLEPGDSELFLTLERVYVLEHKLDDAIATLKHLAQIDPNGRVSTTSAWRSTRQSSTRTTTRLRMRRRRSLWLLTMPTAIASSARCIVAGRTTIAPSRSSAQRSQRTIACSWCTSTCGAAAGPRAA